jgi:hypothetical protein
MESTLHLRDQKPRALPKRSSQHFIAAARRLSFSLRQKLALTDGQTAGRSRRGWSSGWATPPFGPSPPAISHPDCRWVLTIIVAAHAFEQAIGALWLWTDFTNRGHPRIEGT